MNRESLIAAGVDYDEGVRRFCNKKEMYEKFLHRFFELDLMDNLGSCLKNKDYCGAFRVSHDLKSTSGNLSINKFYDAVCALVENLRNGTPDDKVNEQFKTVQNLFYAAKKAVEEND